MTGRIGAIALLNENKIKMMTKMAIYEKNEGQKMLKTAKYYKSDFVSLVILKTIISVTFAFLVILVLVAVCQADMLIQNFNNFDYAKIGRQIATYYIMMVIVFGIISGAVYAYKYETSRKEMKKFFSRLNKLERFYNGQKKN